MNLPVAGVMHQPEIHEVLRPAVTLGLHVVDVDLFPIVQSLVANRTAPVLSPGEVPRATGCAVSVLPPLAPVILESRVIGRHCNVGKKGLPFVTAGGMLINDLIAEFIRAETGAAQRQARATRGSTQYVGEPCRQCEAMAIRSKNARQLRAYARRGSGNQRYTLSHDQYS